MKIFFSLAVGSWMVATTMAIAILLAQSDPGKWGVVGTINKPTSVQVIVFDETTGEVESYDVVTFDDEIPQVGPQVGRYEGRDA